MVVGNVRADRGGTGMLLWLDEGYGAMSGVHVEYLILIQATMTINQDQLNSGTSNDDPKSHFFGDVGPTH